jgi:hypothetical protein
MPEGNFCLVLASSAGELEAPLGVRSCWTAAVSVSVKCFLNKLVAVWICVAASILPLPLTGEVLEE